MLKAILIILGTGTLAGVISWVFGMTGIMFLPHSIILGFAGGFLASKYV